MNRELNITYDAPPTLGRFLGSDAFVRAVLGPVGSGKSSACCIEVLRRATEAPVGEGGLRRSRWVVIRNTYRELADTTIRTFKEWVPEQLGHWRAQDNAMGLRFDDVEADVLFRALDRPADVKKLLSLEVTGAYINEAKEIARGVFDLLQTRVGRYPAARSLPPGTKFWSGVWLDSNPPDTDHWLYKLFEEQKPDPRTFQLFRQPGGLAPNAENLQNLPPDYYQRIAVGKDPVWLKIYRDGEYGFVADGRAIFPEFKDSVHVVEGLAADPGLDLLVGMDFGLTPAAVLGQRDPRDGQLQIFDELVSEDMGAVRFARELGRIIKATYPGRVVRGHGDPAGEQRSQVDETTPFDVVQAAGLPIDPAPTNDFTLRREAVAANLSRLTMSARPGLVIAPKCKQLRKALAGGYCYRRLQVTGRDSFADKPDKGMFSHVADALQYLCVGEGEDRRAVHGVDPEERGHVHIRVRRAMGGLR